MKTNLPALAAAVLALSCLLVSPAGAADSAAPASGGTQDPTRILRQMSAKLAAAQRFTFEAHRQADPGFNPGPNVPEKARIAVAVVRPNQISATLTSPEDVRRITADGLYLTMQDVKKNLYATVTMHKRIDDLVQDVEQIYGFKLPLAEFVLSDIYRDIRWRAQSITYLGRATTAEGFLGMGGVECDRVALSGKVLDAELWVGAADRLPERLVVTAKGRPGKPQMKIEFSQWNLMAKLGHHDFVFVPPMGATKIPMKTTAEMIAAGKKR